MNATDLRSKSSDELSEELVTLRREQFNVRMQQATGESTKPHEHSRIRKDIARVKTILTEQKRSAKAESSK
jgi:large subunit ribosomal protein L29